MTFPISCNSGPVENYLSTQTNFTEEIYPDRDGFKQIQATVFAVNEHQKKVSLLGFVTPDQIVVEMCSRSTKFYSQTIGFTVALDRKFSEFSEVQQEALMLKLKNKENAVSIELDSSNSGLLSKYKIRIFDPN